MNNVSTVFLKRLLPLGLAALVAAVLLAPRAANATPYVVKMVQQGSNVVATGSGAINLSGLDYNSTQLHYPYILPSLGLISTGGVAGSLVASDLYVTDSAVSGPSSFGSGGYSAPGASNGDLVDFSYDITIGLIYLPSGYASESILSNSTTWENANFASLGVTPGTYVWTWGTGAEQSFTLDIVAPTVAAPEPAALGMFGVGVLLIGLFAGLRRRMV
jgi:hypothetical protein